MVVVAVARRKNARDAEARANDGSVGYELLLGTRGAGFGAWFGGGGGGGIWRTTASTTTTTTTTTTTATTATTTTNNNNNNNNNNKWEKGEYEDTCPKPEERAVLWYVMVCLVCYGICYGICYVLSCFVF